MMMSMLGCMVGPFCTTHAGFVSATTLIPYVGKPLALGALSVVLVESLFALSESLLPLLHGTVKPLLRSLVDADSQARHAQLPRHVVGHEK